MIASGYLTSFIIGLLIIIPLAPRTPSWPKTLTLSLALGLGLGISSLITFLLTFFLNNFQPMMIIGANLWLLAILFIRHFRSLQEFLKTCSLPHGINVLLFLLGALIASAIYVQAQKTPYGGWDAWAMWNMKTKFIILGGEHWKNIFTQGHWSLHNDYPILLPCMNAWIYAWGKTGLALIPLINAMLFTILCPILLGAGLRQFTGKTISVLAAFLLLTNPFYVHLGIIQYADVILAYYLLCIIVLLMTAIKTSNNNLLPLASLFMGILSFTKNEGVVMLGMMTLIFSFYIFFKKRDLMKKNALILSMTFLLASSLATILFKLSIAPPNPDIIPNLSTQKILTASIAKKLPIIQEGFLKELLHRKWSFIWIWISLALLINIKHLFKKESLPLTFFFISYTLIVVTVYLTNTIFDVSWYIKNSLPRILFSLLPSMLFWCFLNMDASRPNSSS